MAMEQKEKDMVKVEFIRFMQKDVDAVLTAVKLAGDGNYVTTMGGTPGEIAMMLASVIYQCEDKFPPDQFQVLISFLKPVILTK